MKTELTSSYPNSLPPKHIAVFFEGPWLIRQDPDYDDRFEAVCPYVNAPEHTCDVGIWESPQQKGSAVGLGSTLQEGEKYRVDVSSDNPVNPDTVEQILDAAHDAFHFPYLKPTSADTTLIHAVSRQMRQVSLPKPAYILAAGMSNATLALPRDTNQPISASRTDEVYSYIAFVFVYPYDETAQLDLSTGLLQNTLFSGGETNPHLIFRVRMKDRMLEMDNPPADMCSDCSEENTHVSHSFNALRKMVFIPPANKDDERVYCDIGIYPAAGESIIFDTNIEGIGRPELGLPPEDSGMRFTVKTYASCGTGPLGGCC